MDISRLAASEALGQLPQLADLLQDAVNGGAAVGFLPPLSTQAALAYWQDVIAGLAGPNRLLLAAQAGGDLAGTVQLHLASTANGLHRADVAKLLVHTRYRRQGIGRALMLAVETAARHAGRSTLVLDTRQGDPSEQLYLGVGYARAGVIPEYARSGDGSLHTTVVMYKLLK